jgi:hypothetical protein
MAKQRGYPDRRGMGAESDALSEQFVPNERYQAHQKSIAKTLSAAGLPPEKITGMLFSPIDVPLAEITTDEDHEE